MSDLDIKPNFENGFSLSLGDSASEVSGNVALLNRFQITFFMEGLYFDTSDGAGYVDTYGGRAFYLMGTSRSVSDKKSISAALTIAINNTVESIKNDTPDDAPASERLSKATLSDLSTNGDTISATIDIYPEEVVGSDLPRFTIPIVSV